MVDGVKLKAIEPSRVWKVYKPKEVLTQMHADPKKRKTLLDVLKKYGQDLGELHCIGRLDYWTEGLLLLTNDGELKRAMELPSSGLKRVYRVRVRGRMGEQQVKALTAGVTVEGVKYKGMEVEIDDPRLGTHQEQRREDPVRWGEAEGQDDKVGGEEEGRDSFANHWVSVALREGKNREVRNAMVHVGLTVMRLLRVSYGPIGLQDMQKGSLSTLSAREASQLGRQLRELKLSGVAKNAQQKAGEDDTE